MVCARGVHMPACTVHSHITCTCTWTFQFHTHVPNFPSRYLQVYHINTSDKYSVFPAFASCQTRTTSAAATEHRAAPAAAAAATARHRCCRCCPGTWALCPWCAAADGRSAARLWERCWSSPSLCLDCPGCRSLQQTTDTHSCNANNA